MSNNKYSEPLQFLFTLPEDPFDYEDYDFLALGITTEHIPELAKLVLDEQFYLEDPEDEEWLYPHLFAYRALAQLKTEEAIDAIIQGILCWTDSDWFEWFSMPMSKILGEIGELAVPALGRLLQSKAADEQVLIMTTEYLTAIVDRNPASRDLCVAILTEQLKKGHENSSMVNGFIVAALTSDMRALESVAEIEAAYKAGCVNKKVMGDWNHAQVYLGLKTISQLPANKGQEFAENLDADQQLDFSQPSVTNIKKLLELPNVKDVSGKEFDAQKARAKRKREKEARRKNRGRK
jgi:Protein of unknown function (DUF1186)